MFRHAIFVNDLCAAESSAVRSLQPSARTVVIPNGVGMPNDQLIWARAEWRSALPPKAKVLLYLGRIQRKKGLEALLKAWRDVAEVRHKARREWRLVIVGWDESGHLAELEALAREEALESSIHFAGAQTGDAKRRSYQSADAFILPSLSEGLPMTVLEAWSYSLPVLMTNACNLPEGFSNGAAIQVEPTRQSLAKSLVALFSMPDESLAAVGGRGNALVAERYSLQTVAHQFAVLYRNAVKDTVL